MTSRLTWSNLSWQKHTLDKMAQHPVQLNLKCPTVRESTTSLGRLFQWLVALLVKNLCPSPKGLHAKGLHFMLSTLKTYCSVFSATVSWASSLNSRTASRTSKFVCISGNEWVNLVRGENYSVVNRTVENQPTTIFCLELFSHKERQNYHKLFLKEGTVRLWTLFLL